MLSSDVHCNASSQKAVCLLDLCLVQDPCHAGEPTLDLRHEVALQRSEVQPCVLVSDVQPELFETAIPPMYLPPHNYDIAWSDFILVDHCIEWHAIVRIGVLQEASVQLAVLRIILYEQSQVENFPVEDVATFQWQLHCDLQV